MSVACCHCTQVRGGYDLMCLVDRRFKIMQSEVSCLFLPLVHRMGLCCCSDVFRNRATVDV